MHFTIITPSLNQLEYLKRCAASVRDQVAPEVQRAEDRSRRTEAGSVISVHHHIQDGGSTDGTAEWLCPISEDRSLGTRKFSECDSSMSLLNKENSRQSAINSFQRTFASEADEGMYDALNKAIEGWGFEDDGLKLDNKPQTSSCTDSIVAWLNCDEQYLPGTLGKVASFFAANPAVDILFGGMLMVNTEGNLLACRKALPMRRLFLEASYLYNYSCAMFFRQSLWENLGGFDAAFKNAGDEDLIRRAVKLGAKSRVWGDYLAAFTYAENNLSSDPMALKEHEALKRSGSFASRVFKLPINLLRLGEKFLSGGHVQRTAIEYKIYGDNLEKRSCFRIDHPSCRWPFANKPYLLSHRLK